MQMILIQFTWVFGMPYSTVLMFIYALKWNHALTIQKQIVQHLKPLPVKKPSWLLWDYYATCSQQN